MSRGYRVWIFVALLMVASTCAAGSAKQRIVWWPIGEPALGLYLSAPDGTHQRSFMSNLEPDYNPSFSYDGRWIIFTSERFGSADVFRVHPDGSGLERLTGSPAFDDQGSLSPDGRTLAFVSTRDGGTANIWLLDIATRHVRNLTRNRTGNFRPSWSPDGKWIAFSSDRGMPHLRYSHTEGPAWELMQMTAIYIVHPDGSGLRRLTASDGIAASPRWSPDGQRVIFAQVVDVDSLRQLTGLPLTEVVSLDIHTGARKVYSDGTALVRSPGYVTNTEVGYSVLNPRAKPRATLVYSSGRKGPDGALTPSWSPDGSLLVFARDLPVRARWVDVSRSRDPRYELIGGSAFEDLLDTSFIQNGEKFIYQPPKTQILKLVRWDGSGTVIFDGAGDKRRVGQSVALSADGRKVAFGIFDSQHPNEVGQLVVMDSDGSHFRVMTHEVGHADSPSFSPDGDRLVYRVGSSGERQHTQRGLRILSLADGKITKLTNGWDDFPTWSPRGDRIAFTGFETGDYEIYTIRPDGTGLRQLTHTHGDDAHPVWSPDGNWIAFVSSRMGWKDEAMVTGDSQPYGEIFVMRADGTDVRQLTDDQWEEAVVGWVPSALDAAVIDTALHGTGRSH